MKVIKKPIKIVCTVMSALCYGIMLETLGYNIIKTIYYQGLTMKLNGVMIHDMIPMGHEMTMSGLVVFMPIFRLPSILFMALLFMVGRMFQRFAHERIFDPENILTLKAVAFYCMLINVLELLLQYFVGFALHSGLFSFAITRVGMKWSQKYIPLSSINFDYPTLCLGLLLLVVVYVFEEGLRLREDNSLTV